MNYNHKSNTNASKKKYISLSLFFYEKKTHDLPGKKETKISEKSKENKGKAKERESLVA